MPLHNNPVVEFPRMKNRSWVLGACAIVLITLVLLSPSLDDLQFEPARPFARGLDTAMPILVPGLSIREDTPVVDILFVWLLLVINLLLFLLLLPAELRRKMLRQMLRFAMGLLALLLALRFRLLKWPEILIEGPQQSQPGISAAAAPAAAEVFVPPRIAPWMTYFISLILFWLVGLVLFAIYGAWRRYQIRRAFPLSAISDIARASLSSLNAGRNWGDVVIETYARMNDAVRISRGLQREPSSTPRDFAARLARTGLPASALEELTHLFESVRYGGAPADAGARRRAVACLETILRACGVAA